MHVIGLLGGTFDPVHNGHLRVALELADLVGMTSVRLVPVGVPSHREAPEASNTQRLRMLTAASAGIALLEVDTRELERDGPSYTIDTLEALRAELPNASLCLIIGMDQFLMLHHWHRWREILDFAHLCVVQRPGATADYGPEVARLLRGHEVLGPERLRTTTHGAVLLGQVPVLDISSTRIRTLVSRRRSPDFLVPDAVIDIIKNEQLYASS
ncbi:MAG: nicotinate-nucleotide adenylyltransferase [Pseudomonadota bacterium]